MARRSLEMKSFRAPGVRPDTDFLQWGRLHRFLRQPADGDLFAGRFGRWGTARRVPTEKTIFGQRSA